MTGLSSKSLLYLPHQVRSSGNAFVSQPEGSLGDLHWREDTSLSGVNIGTLGIFYEALQRSCCLLLLLILLFHLSETRSNREPQKGAGYLRMTVQMSKFNLTGQQLPQ